MTSRKSTLLQGLLMAAALLALAAVFLIAREQAAGPGAVADTEAGSTGQSAGDPTAEAVRVASALSDSLQDQTEELAQWLVATADTSGLSARLRILDVAVDESIRTLEPHGPWLALEEYEALLGLFIQYLDVSLLAAEWGTLTEESVQGFLTTLEESRADVESSLMRYVGSY